MISLNSKDSCWYEGRKKWIPAFRTLFSSIGDLLGDWTFYFFTRREDGLGKFEVPVLVFALIATFFGLLAVTNICLKKCTPSDKSNGVEKSINMINVVLALEILLEE